MMQFHPILTYEAAQIDDSIDPHPQMSERALQRQHHRSHAVFLRSAAGPPGTAGAAASVAPDLHIKHRVLQDQVVEKALNDKTYMWV